MKKSTLKYRGVVKNDLENINITTIMGGAGRMTPGTAPPPTLRLGPAPLPKDPRIRTPDRPCGQERSAAKGPKCGRSATPLAASRPPDLTGWVGGTTAGD